MYRGATGIRSRFCFKFTDGSEKEIGSVLIKFMDVKNAKGVLLKSARERLKVEIKKLKLESVCYHIWM